ncbi:MAG: hypothetical protein HRT35_12650 [Algicola sp.]|nr:hypothetical protein [Algicola sp.]
MSNQQNRNTNNTVKVQKLELYSFKAAKDRDAKQTYQSFSNAKYKDVRQTGFEMNPALTSHQDRQHMLDTYRDQVRNITAKKTYNVGSQMSNKISEEIKRDTGTNATKFAMAFAGVGSDRKSENKILHQLISNEIKDPSPQQPLQELHHISPQLTPPSSPRMDKGSGSSANHYPVGASGQRNTSWEEKYGKLVDKNKEITASNLKKIRDREDSVNEHANQIQKRAEYPNELHYYGGGGGNKPGRELRCTYTFSGQTDKRIK